ncbi:pre-mRNA-splicing factor Syf2-like [Spodoptera litura]|uniref:Pre-mRNA-splicing factor SYF2 n=1 Tax=Spodoptera litura TaxID=69820 RepID=A0A9J7E7W1_SPOLT|nr:pre-mRNA-splicing factor Syf2-like [Spodoptera litura]
MSTQAERSSSAPKDMSFAERQIKRIKRLRSLHTARNEARTHNQHEVVAEQARNKLPPNYEAKGRQAEWLLDDQAKHQEAEKAVKDYDRVNLLNLLSAVEAERFKCKKKKRNPDEGFSTYEQATVRQHNKLVKIMPAADMEQYEKQKYGDAFHSEPNVTIHEMHKDREEAIDKMVNDLLEEQIVKRARYSRSRGYFDDTDYYINDKIAKFNKKLEFEDWKLGRSYTTELGTAI